MTKDILLTITGLQYTKQDDGEEQAIETITRGNYYKKSGKHYVSFEETPDGENTAKSLIKFDEDSFEMNRRGKYSVHMNFENGKKYITEYPTPFGNLIMGIDTKSFLIDEREDEIRVSIEYDLDMNYEFVAESRIDVVISSVKE